MRANAPITAILALAALSFSPVLLEARTKHPAASHTSVSHTKPKHTLHKVQDQAPAKKHPRARTKPKAETKPKAVTKPKPRHRHKAPRSVEDTVPATITRIHALAHAAPHAAPHAASKKATTSDFLQAAAPPSAGPTTINAPAHPEDLALQATAKELAASPAKQVGVVSVIRPTADRPSLPPVEQVASTPVILPSLYNKRGHLIVPPPLKGSHEILLRQNQVADRDGLDRIRSDDDILDLRSQKLLVSIPANGTLLVDERLPANRRYCRPWTAQFLATLSHSYYARFHTPLQVNSAVRTVEFQQRLLRTNGNAAPAEGDTASPHLTGQAVDLAKHGLTLTQIAWLRGYLLPLVQLGKVDVEEEFQQACFHISVYKKYLPPATIPRRKLAKTRSLETTALASTVQSLHSD
jgi:hypothetical protein